MQTSGIASSVFYSSNLLLSYLFCSQEAPPDTVSPPSFPVSSASSTSFLATSLCFCACPSFMLSSLSSPYFVSVSPFFSFHFPFFLILSHFSVFFGSLFFIVVSSSSPFFHLISPFNLLTRERLSYMGGRQETLEVLLGLCRHLVRGLIPCWALLEATKLTSQDWPDIYGRHIYFPGVY